MATDVFVIAPIRVHRETLAAALEAADNVKVVGNAATLREALPRLRHLERPAVALLDAPLPADVDLPVPPAAEPETKLIAVGVPESEAVAWIEAGIAGFVPPDGSVDDVVSALERAAEGELAMSPQVTAHLADRVRRLAADSPTPEGRLTSRETEVLELLADGLANKQIAQRLSIQVQTVKNHVHNVLVKLGVNRRAEAAAQTRRGRRRPEGR
jgi:two-component system nitrate/nitrite response regulator NarL